MPYYLTTTFVIQKDYRIVAALHVMSFCSLEPVCDRSPLYPVSVSPYPYSDALIAAPLTQITVLNGILPHHV